VLARLGAEPITLPAGELYTALEKRVIDAVEWVSPGIDLLMGFQEIAEYYYWGGTNPQPNSSTWSIAAASKSSRRTSEQCSWWR
jgi:TRAP-type mannitol/chloroaromatic compound transport system substrate-binding protein